uniref:Uncharacterized protein n=1 Tax=Candidatus Kentrum sp. UNK TaxID=2126344 RepID=A0A451AQZ1_9GAMM|nr:MAG: hypothetical protein BECKUNK1418G_GA0071005_12382 [Candidatus Kentron sp. UNK]VFK73603.1 MAG: hypothetical protein BECKUNK1418H_GA0071006_12282 [Candidatus Kentron sp. UNK]
MGKQGATQTRQGRNATPRPSAGKRPPELLRHHGQRNPVQQFTYRKKKNSEKPGLVIRAYPPSILARSANMFCLSRNAHPVQMAQPQEPAQGIQLGSVQPGSEERRLATRTHPQRPESLSKRGGLLNDWSKSRMGRKAACPVLRGGGYQLSSWVRYCGTAGKPGGKRRKQTLPYRAGSACPTQKKSVPVQGTPRLEPIARR